MADNICTGSATEQQVKAILEAAAPIPIEPIDVWHPDIESSSVSRAEEIVRRLEIVYELVQAAHLPTRRLYPSSKSEPTASYPLPQISSNFSG